MPTITPIKKMRTLKTSKGKAAHINSVLAAADKIRAYLERRNALEKSAMRKHLNMVDAQRFERLKKDPVYDALTKRMVHILRTDPSFNESAQRLISEGRKNEFQLYTPGMPHVESTYIGNEAHQKEFEELDRIRKAFEGENVKGINLSPKLYAQLMKRFDIKIPSPERR